MTRTDIRLTPHLISPPPASALIMDMSPAPLNTYDELATERCSPAASELALTSFTCLQLPRQRKSSHVHSRWPARPKVSAAIILSKLSRTADGLLVVLLQGRHRRYLFSDGFELFLGVGEMIKTGSVVSPRSFALARDIVG
jgi:hypothetical protein